MTTSSITGVEALPPDVWPCIFPMQSNLEVCSLSASSKACWQVSCYNRNLKIELDADENLQNRLASLLFFLTSRRKHLQVEFTRYSGNGNKMLAVAPKFGELSFLHYSAFHKQ